MKTYARLFDRKLENEVWINYTSINFYGESVVFYNTGCIVFICNSRNHDIMTLTQEEYEQQKTKETN